jgi:hypothetical protein
MRQRDFSLRRPTRFRPGRNLRSQETNVKEKALAASVEMTVGWRVLTWTGMHRLKSVPRVRTLNPTQESDNLRIRL